MSSGALANQFVWGMLTMACAFAALLFVRSWRLTGERLLLFFALAFGAFALNWIAFAVVAPAAEGRYSVYLLRLLGFAFIIVGILDKNRRGG